MWLRSISFPLLSLKCNANVSKNREGMQRKFWRRFVVEGPPEKAASLLRRERVGWGWGGQSPVVFGLYVGRGLIY